MRGAAPGGSGFRPSQQQVEPAQKPRPTGGSYVPNPVAPDDEEPLSVFMAAPVLDDILAHSTADPDRVAGGVLIGHPYEDRAGRYLEIHGYVPASRAIGRKTSFRFTNEVWVEAVQAIDAKWPGQWIAGWHLSRPGEGVGLSDADIALHSSLFNLPWQVALVVDPVSRACGFFVWDENRIRPAGFSLMEGA